MRCPLTCLYVSSGLALALIARVASYLFIYLDFLSYQNRNITSRSLNTTYSFLCIVSYQSSISKVLYSISYFHSLIFELAKSKYDDSI